MAKIDDSVKKKVPELRFKGFTDDWEERKLENIAQINKGIQRGKQEISSVRNELNPYPVYNGGKKASGYTDECNRENSVMVSEGGASAGYVNYYSGKYWSGGHNFTISNDTKHDTFFLLYVLQKSQEKLYKLQVGTGLPNIQLKSIKDFPIYSTSNTEQQKIGSFFKQLDNTIALHQRKLDLLKEQKKGYLQKMFPKNGAKVPELRFAGFADDWEERNLGDTETHFTDGNYGESYPSAKDMSDKANGIPFLRGSDFSNGYLDSSNANYIKPEKHAELTSGHIKQDDIVLAVRGSLGTLGYATQENEGWNINSQLAILRTKKSEISGMFLIQYLLGSKGQKEIFSRNTGTALKQLPIKQLKDIPVPVPTLLEQQKIGNFFKELDSTIALHQRKLDLLKEQKKGFLQKMFV